MAKPSGSACNIGCKYCFFLSKEALYPGSSQRMSDETLEAYIGQLLESHRAPEVTIAWQGGEPTLMGLPFFERAVALAERLKRPDQRLQHTIQTNGIALDDDWCAFFAAKKFLVGLSVDGPRELHDAYRVTCAGKGSFELVMKGWQALRRHGVEFNILCTVHAANEKRAFGLAKRDTLTRQCRDCDVVALCNGDCPKNRFVASVDGEPGQSYLCAGLHAFFSHVTPAMRQMAALLREQPPPAAIMALTKARDAAAGPCSPCPCGSGAKLKFCHGKA
jgi:radical SAM protein with 4Fe4S-binding SPASM domain